MTKSILADVDLKVLQMIGQDPYGHERIKNFIVFVAILLLTVVCALGIMAVYIYYVGIETLANVLFMESSFYQFGWKMFTYRYYISMYHKLFHIIEQEFWPDNKFGDAVKDKINFIRNGAQLGVRIYKMVVAISMPIVFIVQPMIQTKRQVPFPIDNIVDLNNTVQYISLYTAQLVVCLYGVPFLVGFDILFVCLVMLAINQLYMLKHAFKTLNIAAVKTIEDEDECYEKIKCYVTHHNMLFAFIKDINKIHSLLMLNQFLACVITLCGILYSLTDVEGRSDYARTTQYVLCVSCFTTQLALYCVAGNEIIDASLAVGDEMYQSDWWMQHLPRIRHATQMVIMRSQRPQRLSAGGILVLNYATFAAIIKSSFSFFTLLQSVTGNDEVMSD